MASSSCRCCLAVVVTGRSIHATITHHRSRMEPIQVRASGLPWPVKAVATARAWLIAQIVTAAKGTTASAKMARCCAYRASGISDISGRHASAEAEADADSAEQHQPHRDSEEESLA